MADYFVIRTNRNCEHRATLSLRARGFNVYTPVIERAGHMLPLFAGYVFAMDDGRGVAPILDAYGVDHVVAVNDEPVRVALELIGRIQQREFDGYVRIDNLPVTFSGLLKSPDGFELLFRNMRGAMRALAFVAWLIKNRPVASQVAAA